MFLHESVTVIRALLVSLPQSAPHPLRFVGGLTCIDPVELPVAPRIEPAASQR